MIELKRRELLEMASAYVVANTARSLFDSLVVDCSAVSYLRRQTNLQDLLAYYDRLTARARRSEVGVGLAYGVLVGILLHKDNVGAQIAPDTSRLQWGEHLHEIAKSANTPNAILELKAGTPRSRVDASSSPGSTLILPRNPEK